MLFDVETDDIPALGKQAGSPASEPAEKVHGERFR
jgi:hypothetical protein